MFWIRWFILGIYNISNSPYFNIKMEKNIEKPMLSLCGDKWTNKI